VLAKRIIPTLLVRGRTLVKGERFDSWRSIGHAAQAARVHAMRGVDELCILDIAATKEGRGPDLDMVRELSDACFVPITVGGGVRSLDDIDALLRAGADKVCIGAAAFDGSGLVAMASARFGRQAIVVSLDHPANRLASSTAWLAQCMEDDGAGEILLQSIERDGTMQGYDLELIRSVSDAVSIPVIASGGCGFYADMLAAFHAGADACAAGAMFAFSDQTPRGAATYLREHSMEVRL
jgi:imidazole glycerol-phosphate synthase subunit HisF